MINLLKYEKNRVINSKSFWIILAVSTAFTLLSIIVTKVTAIQHGDIITFQDGSDIHQIFIGVYGVDALISGMSDFLVTLVPVLISIFVAAELGSNGTIKNIISRGYTKQQVFISKLIVSYIIILVVIIISVIFHTILASVFWGFSKDIVPIGKVLSLFTTKLFAFFALGTTSVAIAFIVRNVGGAIAISVGLLRLMPFTLNSIILLANNDGSWLAKYEISSAISSIIDSNTSQEILLTVLFCSLGYILIFSFLGMSYTKYNDI